MKKIFVLISMIMIFGAYGNRKLIIIKDYKNKITYFF